MSTRTRCYHCGRVTRRCRQILRFEPGDGWHIVKLMSGDILERIKHGWEDRYICPACHDFEVTVMLSWIKLTPSPLRV